MRGVETLRGGFYKMRREMYGRVQCVLALAKPGTKNTFSIHRPNTGASFFEMDVDELNQKYTKYKVGPGHRAGHCWLPRHVIHPLFTPLVFLRYECII